MNTDAASREALLLLARSAIASALGAPRETPATHLPVFDRRQGAFVTLTLHERESGRAVIIQIIAFRTASYPALAREQMESLVGIPLTEEDMLNFKAAIEPNGHQNGNGHGNGFADEMGNIKKLTARDVAKLRGKDRMFDGAWDDLKMGQIVSVTYVVPPLKKKGEELDAADSNLISTKVVVVQEAPQPRR